MSYAFVIEPSEHAVLSASSAERWTTCPGSIEAGKGLPNHASSYAAEGTAAHHIAAAEQESGRMNAMHWAGLTAMVEGYEIALTEELCGAVQEFLDYVMENERQGDDAAVEQSFTPAMRKLHPMFGGSTDRVMWRASERLLRVYDYKHGAGVSVDVDDNKQLKYYALGALLSNPKWKAETVELVIAQPRCDHEQGRIRTYRMQAFELLEYAADLVAAAKATQVPNAPRVPSAKGCKFCPAFRAKTCKAVEERNTAIVEAAFSALDIARYSPAQIAEFLEKAPLVEAHISAVREFAYQQAVRGEKYPGWKIVEKRPTRKWADEKHAAAALAGVGKDIFTEPKLKSPAQVEKIVGKKQFAALDLPVEKISSGLTLAPDADPRPPVEQGAEKVIDIFESLRNDSQK